MPRLVSRKRPAPLAFDGDEENPIDISSSPPKSPSKSLTNYNVEQQDALHLTNARASDHADSSGQNEDDGHESSDDEIISAETRSWISTLHRYHLLNPLPSIDEDTVDPSQDDGHESSEDEIISTHTRSLTSTLPRRLPLNPLPSIDEDTVDPSQDDGQDSSDDGIANLTSSSRLVNTQSGSHIPPSPFAQSADPLHHVVALTRLSGYFNNSNGKLTNLGLRREEMVEKVIDRHQMTHTGCHCEPSKTTILLNNVSSNTSTDPQSDMQDSVDSASSRKIEELRKTLLKVTRNLTDVDTTVVIVVCTADGLLTNVYSFVNIFAQFRDCCVYYYMLEEGGYRIFFLPAILNAIHAVLNGSNKVTPECQLVRQWIRIAYTKMYQREANLTLRIELSGARRNTISLDGDTLSRFDPGDRVVRFVESGGTAFRPSFTSAEEERIELRFQAGMILCPICTAADNDCPHLFATHDDLIVHMMTTILTSEVPTCPLCPEVFDQWNFISIVSGIQHLIRHVSPTTYAANHDGKLKNQCPYCLKLMTNHNALRDHMYNFHACTTQIRSAAMLSGHISAEDISVLDSHMKRCMVMRAVDQLQEMSPTLQKLRELALTDFRKWPAIHDAAQISDEAKLPDLSKDLSSRAAITSSGSLIAPIMSGSVVQAWVNPHIPRQNVGHDKKRSTVEIEVDLDDDGRVQCPLEACQCGEYFVSYWELCHHVWDFIWETTPPDERKCPWCPVDPHRTPAEPFAQTGPKGRKNGVRHLARHLPSDLCCPKCKFGGTSVEILSQHLRDEHLKHHCQTVGCGGAFGTIDELRVHERECGT